MYFAKELPASLGSVSGANIFPSRANEKGYLLAKDSALQEVQSVTGEEVDALLPSVVARAG